MILYDVQQDTPEWHQFRAGGIGASEAPVLLGLSPWTNISQLFLDKTGQGEPKEWNWAMQRGKDMEPVARDMWIKANDIIVNPACAVHSPEKFFVRASFDGLSDDHKTLIEIKVPGLEAHKKAVQKTVPLKYRPQLQWQMLVAELDKMEYVSLYKDDFRTVEYVRDEAMIRQLIEKAEWFWDLVERGVPPNESLGDDIMGLITEYGMIDAQLKLLEAQKAELQEQIKPLVETKVSFNGYTASWIEKVGNVDYKKIPQLKGVDLEQFRKKGSRYFSIRSAGGKDNGTEQ